MEHLYQGMVKKISNAFILAIDPGNIMSAYVIVGHDLKPLMFGKVKNEELKEILYERCYMVKGPDGQFVPSVPHVAIEMIASYGMAVGKEVYDTCVWIGRFDNAIEENSKCKPTFIYRKDEKMNLCGSMKAKDGNIRKALIDRFATHDFKNGKGTKKDPDWFYGFKADIWQAYAVTVTYHDMYCLDLVDAEGESNG